MKQKFTLAATLRSLLVVMLLSALPVRADVTIDQLDFNKLEDNTWEVRQNNFNGKLSGTLEIPAYHEGLPVTAIARSGFRSCDGITCVKLPETITRLEEDAFEDCLSLTQIMFSESVAYIGNGAFTNCQSLNNIELPESVTYIGELAFWNCTKITEVELPRQVAFLGGSAFAGMNLNRLTIHCSLTPENSNHFYVSDIPTCLVKDAVVLDCETLYIPDRQFQLGDKTKITFSENIATIPAHAFENFYHGLFELPEGIVSIGDYAFKKSFIKEIVIPSSVEHLGKGAFAGCNSLEKVEIKDGLTAIGDGAFMGTENLKNIKLPQTLKAIGKLSFFASGFEEIVLPESLEYIDKGAFASEKLTDDPWWRFPEEERIAIYGELEYFDLCDGMLKKITFPQTPVDIGSYAFTGQRDLTDFRLVASIIGEAAFWECVGLIHPDITVTEEIGKESFRSCYNISEFPKFDGAKRIGEEAFVNALNIPELRIPDCVVEIGKRAFADTSFVTLVLGEGLVDIGPEVFSNASLTEIVWNKGLKSIGDMAFENCNISSLELPEGVERIGAKAFYRSYNHKVPLTNVVIPASLKEIGESCFGDLLEIIEMKSPMPFPLSQKNMGYDAEKAAATLVLVPHGAKEAYLADPMWDGLCIKEQGSGKVTIKLQGGYDFDWQYQTQTDVAPEDVLELKIIDLDDAQSTLHRNYSDLDKFINCMVFDLSETNTFDIRGTAFRNKTKLKRLIFPDKQYAECGIENREFQGCVSLEYVKVPDNITGFGDSTFAECYNLREINMPSSISVIEDSAFRSTGLRSIDFGGTELTYIGDNAFMNCQALLYVSFENTPYKGHMGITTPGYEPRFSEEVFKGCSNLKEVRMNNTEIEALGERYFYGCNSLRKVELPEGLTKIADESFYNTLSLEFITLPETLSEIGENAFYNSGLRSIVIPAATQFGTDAFYCPRLVCVTLPKNCQEIGNNVFFGNIKHLTSPNFKAPEISEDTFYFWDSKFLNYNSLYFTSNVSVPNDEESKESYVSHPVWGRFRNFDFSLVIDSEMDDNWVDTSMLDSDTYDDVKDDMEKEEEDEEEEEENPDAPQYSNSCTGADLRRADKASVQEKLLKVFAPVYDKMSTTCTEDNHGYYVHVKPKGDARIIKVEFDGKDITSQLKDGVLLLPAVKKSAKLKITTDKDGTDSIYDPFISKGEKGAIYDLYGRRVHNPGKGIYIRDGKKIVL